MSDHTCLKVEERQLCLLICPTRLPIKTLHFVKLLRAPLLVARWCVARFMNYITKQITSSNLFS